MLAYARARARAAELRGGERERERAKGREKEREIERKIEREREREKKREGEGEFGERQCVGGRFKDTTLDNDGSKSSRRLAEPTAESDTTAPGPGSTHASSPPRAQPCFPRVHPCAKRKAAFYPPSRAVTDCRRLVVPEGFLDDSAARKGLTEKERKKGERKRKSGGVENSAPSEFDATTLTTCLPRITSCGFFLLVLKLPLLSTVVMFFFKAPRISRSTRFSCTCVCALLFVECASTITR